MVISVKQKIFLSLILVSLFASLSFGFYLYFNQKSSYYNSIKYQLNAGINASLLYLGEDYVDSYTLDNPISEDEHLKNVKALSTFAKNSSLQYVYSMVKDKEKVRTLISSATDEELEKEIADNLADWIAQGGTEEDFSYISEKEHSLNNILQLYEDYKNINFKE